MNWLYKISSPNDYYPQLFSILEKYKDKGLYIHFSKIPKIGINPKPSHRDPIGIYFFPLDWFFDNQNTTNSYYWSSPYMFVCDIQPRNLLNIGSVTEESLQQYLDQLNVSERKTSRRPQHQEPSPGADLWYSVEQNLEQESKGKRYNVPFRQKFLELGFDAILDPGTSSIHPNEPAQLIALDPSIIRVVEMSKTPGIKPHGQYDDDYYNKKYPFYSKNTQPSIKILTSLASLLSININSFKSPSNSSKGIWSANGSDQHGNKIKLYAQLSRSGKVDYKSFSVRFSANWYSNGEEIGVSDLYSHDNNKMFDITTPYKEIVDEFAQRVLFKMQEKPMDDTSYVLQVGEELSRELGGAKVSSSSPIWGDVSKKIGDCVLNISYKYEHEKGPSYSVGGNVKIPKHSFYPVINPSFGQYLDPIPSQNFAKTVSSSLYYWLSQVMERHFKNDEYRYMQEKMQSVLEYLKQISTKNASHTQFYKSAFVSGEWFIDDFGYASYADGDIGDKNHEIVAIESMIPEELLEQFQNKTLTDEQIDEIGRDFIEFMYTGGDAREWMVTKKNWIRVHGDNFELNRIDENAIKRMADFLYEQSENYDDDTESTASQDTVYIEERSTGLSRELTVQEIFNADNNPVLLGTLIMKFRREQKWAMSLC